MVEGGKPDFYQGYILRKKVEFRGVDIDYLGVEHSNATLKKYSNVTDNAISEADYVLLEATPIADGALVNGQFTPPYIKAYQDLDKNLPNDKAEAILQQSIDLGIAFFGAIEQKCYDQGKHVIATDPLLTTPESLPESNMLRGIDYIGRFLSMFGLPLVAAVNSWQAGKSVINGLLHQKMDRRGFLRNVAMGVAAGTTGLANFNLNINGPEFDLGYLSSLSVGLTDYRDVSNSKIFDEKIVKTMQGKRVAVIYGAGHLNPFFFYLQHSEIRDFKMAGYRVAAPFLPQAKFRKIDRN